MLRQAACTGNAEELFLLGSLCTVLGTGLVPVGNALGIQSAADDVVTYTRQVTYTAAADQNYRVFLQVVTDTGDVAGSFHTVGQTNLGDLTDSRVRLLGGGGMNLGAYATLLGCALFGGNLLQRVEALLQCGRLGLVGLVCSALLNQLIKSRHLGNPPFLL